MSGLLLEEKFLEEAFPELTAHLADGDGEVRCTFAVRATWPRQGSDESPDKYLDRVSRCIRSAASPYANSRQRELSQICLEEMLGEIAHRGFTVTVAT